MTVNYEPVYGPQRELEINLNSYQRFLESLHEVVYDAMEVVNELGARDGIEWALQQLDGQVDEGTLSEIAQLDRKLKEEAEYLVRELDAYGSIMRDEPRSAWWWYLDEMIEGAQPVVEVLATLPFELYGRLSQRAREENLDEGQLLAMAAEQFLTEEH